VATLIVNYFEQASDIPSLAARYYLQQKAAAGMNNPMH